MAELLLRETPPPGEFYGQLAAQAEMVQKLSELGIVEQLIPEGFPDLNPIHVLGARLTAVQRQIKDWKQRAEFVSKEYGLVGGPFNGIDSSIVLEGIRRIISTYEDQEVSLLTMFSEQTINTEGDSV